MMVNKRRRLLDYLNAATRMVREIVERLSLRKYRPAVSLNQGGIHCVLTK